MALWLLQIRLQVLSSTVQSDANSVLKGSKCKILTVFDTKILTFQVDQKTLNFQHIQMILLTLGLMFLLWHLSAKGFFMDFQCSWFLHAALLIEMKENEDWDSNEWPKKHHKIVHMTHALYFQVFWKNSFLKGTCQNYHNWMTESENPMSWLVNECEVCELDKLIHWEHLHAQFLSRLFLISR